MNNGKLQLNYKLDNSYELHLSTVNASDGQWHKVTLERYGKEFILKLDGGEGRYYTDSQGPVNGAITFTPMNSQTSVGAEVAFSGGSVGYVGQDMTDSKFQVFLCCFFSLCVCVCMLSLTLI